MASATDSDHWTRLEKLFYQALDLEPTARIAFLNQACGDNASLRKEVESLLKSSDKTFGFLQKPIEEAVHHLNSISHGQRVGPYQLTGLLGEGGMGKVYLATRADHLYEQEVAIKLMHAGAKSQGLLLRFTTERQILANLNHPNIARLLDGGVTEEESPYLVMEYVKGVSIDRYCRERSLGIKDRLQLFRTVCTAVEYAHKNLVVHRDIKPANILVTQEGMPKLLDFGIAKLLSLDPDEQALTRTTDRMMTPEYASPEQVRGDPITTSTDVYALGVLLYELLAGKRPFRLGTKSPLEVVEVICGQDPEPPSAVTRGGTEPDSHRIAKEISGDLDNIVLMAMRKEPARRYISVSALSADIQAHAQGYPVSARTDTWAYRSGKFMGRHRAAVTATACVALALVAFSIGMGLLARRATRERLTAEREAQFLNSIFQASTPLQARGKQVSARELLDNGAKRIDGELADEPVLQASMLENIGHAYIALGVYDQAESLFRRAYDLRTKTSGRNSAEAADSLDGLATTLRLESKYQQAEPLFRQSLTLRKKQFGNDNALVAQSMSNLGECLYWESRWAEAEPLLRKALATKRQLHDDSDNGTENFLALVLERKGDYQEAAQLLREALEISRRVEGTDGPEYVVALHNLAGTLIDAGDLSGAETMERQSLEIRRRILGEWHPEVYYSLNNLGWILLQKGEWQAAEPFLRDNLTLVHKNFGENSSKTAVALKNWGLDLQERGNYTKAEQTFKSALDIATRVAGEKSWYVARILSSLGQLEFDRGRYDKAESYAGQALDLSRQLGGEDSPDVAAALIDVAEARVFQGDPRGAESMLRRALEIREKKFNPGNPAVVYAEVRFGEDLTLEGKPDSAELILRNALRSARSQPFRLLPWQIAEAESALGACLAAKNRSPEAEKLLHESELDLKKDPRPAFRYPANARATLFRAKPVPSK
jgi:eukaryotic-like serine/threonine-protein kinase